MKSLVQRLVVTFLAVALAVTMFPLPAFAVGEEMQGAEEQTQQAKRTILLYDCGADLETDAGLATYNLLQILESRFSADDDISFLVMTGGSHKWQIDKSKLVFPDGVALPEDAVVEYDSNNRAYVDKPSDPRSQVSNVYNQIWEARGVDAALENGSTDRNAGKLVLLDGDGITGAENEAVKSENELMSDPATLKAFINYGVTNFPAEKYDLILWDHGGGPVGGFGVDEHKDDLNDWNAPSIMSFAGIVEALSDNAVTNADADGDGMKDKFDFIDFDACLMNSVELALVMADYTDYYIASAEVEPGYGQYYGPSANRDGKQYKGWLDELGNPANDAKYDAPGGTYELGKVIVDDFYNFYEKETGDGHSQEGTLAVVDTQKMTDSQFVNTLTELARLIRVEAGSPEKDGAHFYDEMKSYYNSIEYGGNELFDLGNLSALLSVVISEISEENVDQDDDYYINANNYHDISRTLNRMLEDEVFMYAKGTSGITTDEQYYRTLDDELGFGKLGSSGMSIYFPGLEMTMSVTDYFKEMDPVIDRMSDGKRKTFLKYYEAAVAYYGMIFYSGKTVDNLINNEDAANDTKKKSEVDYDLVMSRMKDKDFGNWDQLVSPCFEKIKAADPDMNEKRLDQWFRTLIPQQADDAVDAKEVTVEKLDQQESGACKVIVNGAKKRVINSVERSIYVELPVMEEYVRGLDPDTQVRINNEGLLPVGTIEGKLVSQPKGNTIRDMVRWYKESGGTWAFDPLEEKWYAISDAGGDAHVASIYLSDEDGIYVPALVGTEAEGADASRLVMLEFAPEKPHKITSVYYMNTDTGAVQVEPKNLTREINVIPVIVVKQMFKSDIYVPISHSSFAISASNAGSISLDYMDISKIQDIGDTNGDDKAIDSAIAITDIYGYKIDITDRIQIKKAKIKPARYTGEELEPKVVYLGETLQAGVDYIWVKERVWNEETQKLEPPAFIEPGDYKISLYGKGRFIGRSIEVTFSILKKNNTLKVKPKKATVKYNILKKKTQKLEAAKVIRFIDEGVGRKSYKKLSGSREITINKKSGKVTVKKGLKKGTYKVRVRVRAAGDAHFKASARKTVTLRIRVK